MKKFLIVLMLALVLALPVAAQDSTTAAPVNYCAGTLSYDPPADWVANPLQRTQYGTALRIASNQTALSSKTLTGS